MLSILAQLALLFASLPSGPASSSLASSTAPPGGLQEVSRERIARARESSPDSSSGGIARFDERPAQVEGEHARVRTDFGGEATAAAALELAESAWRITGGLLGPGRSTRHADLRTIQLYRTETAYARAEDDLTGGFFRGNLSFSHWKTRSAHIALQPPVGSEVLAAVGLPYQTRRLIAHEAAHLAVFDTLPNFRYHPFWFAEGLAQWVEARVVLDRGLAMSLEQDPFFSQYLSVGVDLTREEDLPRLEMLLVGATADLDSHTRYALAWLMMEFLAEPGQRAILDRIVAVLRKLPAGPELEQRLAEDVTKDLGAATLQRLGDEFERWVAARQPRWRESARSLETAGAEWVHLGFPGRGGVAWSTDPVPSGAYTLHGTARLLNPSRGDLSLLLAEGERGHLSIVLHAGGVVYVQAWEAGSRQWKRLAAWSVPGVDFSRPTPFRVDAGDSGAEDAFLEITLGGGAARRVAVPGWDLSGAWGLGVGSGAAGVWTNVRLQPAGDVR